MFSRVLIKGMAREERVVVESVHTYSILAAHRQVD